MISGFKKALAVTSSLAVLLAAPVQAADVSTSMSNFFDDSRVMGNATGPTAYQGQKMGYYTAGNLSLRMPQETTQLATVQLPSMRAGCGGIDIFSGGFSFINADQLVANLKAIASNAGGYVFLLALKMLSPTIANQLETLQDWTQKMNAMNINSCEAAQSLVDSAWTKIDANSKYLCQALSNEDGTYSDPIAARHGCSSNTAKNLANQDPTSKNVIPVNTNLAWEAVKRQPMFSNNTQLAELMMTLSGSVIYSCPTGSDNDGCKVTVLPAAVWDDGTINVLLDGGPMKVHQCDENSKCLAPTQYARSVTIASTSAFKWQVQTMMLGITTAIQNKTGLTTEQQQFLGMVSLPVHKMLAVNVAYNRQMAGQASAQYTEVIALDLTYTWITRMMTELEQGAANLQNVETSQLEAWRNSLAQARMVILQRQGQLQTRTSAIQLMVSNTQAMEQVLTSRVAGRVGNAVAFSSSMKTQ